MESLIMSDKASHDTLLDNGGGFQSVSDYFQTPDRQGLIQQLVHLAQFSDGVPVVQGVAGSGKSTIVDELKRQLLAKGTHYFACVQLDDSQEFSSILFTILSSFGLPGSASATAGEMLAQLRSFSQEVAGDKHLGVVVIDDAHFLSDQALGGLISLLQGNDASGHGLHLIFFSRLGLVERIDKLELLDISIYDFEVPLLSLNDFTQFSNMSLSKDIGEEASAAFLTQERLLNLWTQTQGAPGAAIRLLNELVQSETQNNIDTIKSIPLGHILALVLLLSVLGWAFFVREDTVSEPPRIAGEGILPLKGDGSLNGNAEANKETKKESTMDKLLERAERSKKLSKENTQKNTLIESPGNLRKRETFIEKTEKLESLSSSSQAERQAKAKSEPAEKLKADEKATQNKGGLEQPSVSDQPIVEVKKPSLASEQLDASRAQTITSRTSSVGSAKPLLNSAGEKANGRLIRNAPDRVPIVAADNIAFENDERLLLDHDPQTYTLQVVAASNKQSLRDYISRQSNRAELFLYQGMRENKRWYIVVAGIYKSRAEATEAIKSLPPEQRKAGPWPKLLKTIHGEIAANRSR